MMKLKGDHGLVGNSHIAAPYDNNGMVFEEHWDEDIESLWWRRVPVADAKDIIRCNECSEPAVVLDHYWPHYNDKTLCEKHEKSKK